MTNSPIKGSLHIGKIMRQYPGKDTISIELTDEASSCRFLEVELTLEEAAQAFFFNGHVDVDIELRGLDNIGKTMEWTIVPIPYEGWGNAETLAQVIADARIYEENGWKMREPHSWNGHDTKRTEEGQVYNVTFRRYV